MDSMHKFGSGSYVKANTAGLDDLIKNLDKRFYTKLGILGSKASRHGASSKIAKGGGHGVKRGSTAQVTNAEVAIVHEFGSKSKRIPRRSFLKMPIETKLTEEVFKMGKDHWMVLLTSNPVLAYKRLGLVGERIVQKAFATGGFGKWAPLSKGTITGKHSSSILIDTAQLRRSVTSQVVVP